MQQARLRKFLSEEGAGATVEFVAIVGFFLLLAFMIIEIALAIYWEQTTLVAAQMGARYAVVYDPVVTNSGSSISGASNGLNSTLTSATYGQSCDISKSTANDPCSPPYTALTCAGGSGGSCDSNQAAFTAIVAKMQTILNIQASNVTIQYKYVGLGFVGGPVVPAVTVSVSGVPFAGGFGDVLSGIFGFSSLTTVPTMSATYTGEDLSSSGAS